MPTIGDKTESPECRPTEIEMVNRFPSQFPHGGVGWVPGWATILERLVQDVEGYDLPAGFHWRQIKEKFGKLRAYHSGGEEVETRVEAAADEASSTCQICGNTGRFRVVDGIALTVCDIHLLARLPRAFPDRRAHDAWLHWRHEELDGQRPVEMEADADNVSRVFEVYLQQYGERIMSRCQQPEDLVWSLVEPIAKPSDILYGAAVIGPAKDGQGPAQNKTLVLALKPDGDAIAGELASRLSENLAFGSVRLLRGSDYQYPSNSSNPLLASQVHHYLRRQAAPSER